MQTLAGSPRNVPSYSASHSLHPLYECLSHSLVSLHLHLSLALFHILLFTFLPPTLSLVGLKERLSKQHWDLSASELGHMTHTRIQRNIVTCHQIQTQRLQI